MSNRIDPLEQEDQNSQDANSVLVMNNSKSVLTKIANLYAEQLMSDIILVVGKAEYPAHRVILCASSDVFQVMLMNPEWRECRKRVIELVEEPCCELVFPQFLKYLYVGKIKVSLNTVMPMLILGHKYNVQDVVELCVDYMRKHIAKAATQGFLISWLQYTTSFSSQHKNLTETLKQFLKWNLEMVAEAKDFIEMEPSLMSLLLQQNDLVVRSEYKLYSILQNWLLKRKEILDDDNSLSPSEKYDLFVDLIEHTVIHIRFGMMTTRELANLISSPLVDFHKEFMVQRFAIGMSYQSGQKERVIEVLNSSGGSLQFTPRLYLNDTWSVGIEVQNFSKLDNYATYVNCFFSQVHIAEAEDDQPITWEIEFYPKGVKYGRAKMVCGEDVPEVVINTVRLRVICRCLQLEEQRFRIAVLLTGVQNKINHILTLHERIEYFSHENRVLNMDNLIPFAELGCYSIKLSPHLIGVNRNDLLLQVIIAPMGPFTNRDSPPFDCN